MKKRFFAVAAFLALGLVSCDQSGSQNADDNAAENEAIGQLNAKPGDKTIEFKPHAVVGTDITLHGDYSDSDLFGEVLLTNGSHGLLLDNRSRDTTYSGVGLSIPAIGVIRRDEIQLESQAARYVEHIQKNLLDKGIPSKTLSYVKTETPVSPAIITTLELDLSEAPDSPSYIRNLILVSLNKNVTPNGLVLYRDNLTDEMLVTLTFWNKADAQKDPTHVWVSSFNPKNTDDILIKYDGILSGAALSFLKK